MYQPTVPVTPPWVEPTQLEDAALLAEKLLKVMLGTTDGRPLAKTSIYEALSERRRMCRPDLGDWRPLAPQPEVNSLLRHLVAILQGTGFMSPNAGIATAVDRMMSERVDECPGLSARADALRQICAEAETEMERHFSSRWSARLANEDAASGLQSLAEVMSDFPYLDGYRELVAAEAALLRKPSRIIFGGAGPLPISGLLIASMTGADVVLVDSDDRATARSSQLIRALEERGLIRPGRISVQCEDLAEVSLERPCDGIIVASLVDPDAKIRLAQRLGEHAGPRPLLILRSAIGMCARLAYRAVPRDAVVATGLKYAGELAPANHVVKGLDPATALQVRRQDGPRP